MSAGRRGARSKADAGPIQLPPREEWDFRGISTEECALACCWEYARELPQFTKDPKCWIRDEEKRRASPIYLFWEGKHLEKGWLTMSPAERREVVDSRNKPDPLGVSTVGKFLSTWLGWTGGDLQRTVDLIKRRAGHAYVIYPQFERYGAEVVIKKFEAWARSETRRVARPLRGKAAEPPFKCLKWLSAYRLEAARRRAGWTYGAVRDVLCKHQRDHRVRNEADVLPIYASHGAWCKAVGDAKGLLRVDENGPMALWMKLLEPARSRRMSSAKATEGRPGSGARS